MSSTGFLNQAKAAKKSAHDVIEAYKRPRHRYAWHYLHSPVRENTILFESFHGKNISDSPLYMMRAFLADPRSKGFKVYCSTNKADYEEHRALVQALGLDVSLVPIDTMRYAHLLATTKYLVNNSSFPAYFTRRPEQRYIQTWHGTPLKTLGKQMRLGIESMYNVQHNFLQANVITFPNEFTRDVMMRDYNLVDLYTGTVALLGYPRNQVFFDESKRREIRAAYRLDEFETFAYMPTWRGANNYSVDIENYRAQTMEQLGRLDQSLRDDQRLYVNFHSMVASKIKLGEFKHILPFPADADNYEFLNAMDALITDYSSVFFDYAITRKPIILFAYDIDEYLAERGMYLDIHDLPFPLVTGIDELADLMRSGAYKNAGYAGTDFEQRFLCYDKPDAAKRALELLFGNAQDDVPLQDFTPNTKRHWNTIEPLQQGDLADVKTACAVVNPETDIAVFYKSSFNEDKSRYLHDEHRDDFNYVFMNKAYVCTPREEIGRTTDAAVSQAIVKRERDRLFPNLDVPEEPVGIVYSGEVGSNLVCPNDSLEIAPAKVRCVKGALHITPKNDIHAYRNLVLIQGRRVTWKRPITEEEFASGTIKENFSTLGHKPPSGKYQRAVKVFLDGTAEDGRMMAYAVGLKQKKATDDDTLASTLAPLFLGSHADPDLVVVPYASDLNTLTLRVDDVHGYLSLFKVAELVSLKRKRGQVCLDVRLRDTDFLLEDFILLLRNETKTGEIHLPYTATVEGDWIHVSTSFDPAKLPFCEIYWDAFLVVYRNGCRGYVPIKFNQQQLWRLYLGNQQWRIGDDKVLFSHIAKRETLSFIYRDYYPHLDTYETRLKEFAAFALFALGHPYWKRKRIWLVYEKFCKLAQDNAYYFFDYCMSLPEEQRKHIFYVIDKSQPDYQKLAPYDAQVLDFMSFKHILYTMVAKLYIASDSRTHLYVWRSKPSIIRRRIAKHKIFFLQHGVTALKQVAHLFGKQGSSPMTYFLTTSANEQEIVVDNFGYRSNQAPVLGFSRWDVLEDKSSADAPSILLMPTWRPWLEEQSDEVFVASDYFKAYSSLIQSEALGQVLERYNAKLRFFIHPKLSSMLGNFEASSDRIELVPQGSEPLNEVMMESNMAITDYSSICWDMLYMDKPVVFYQFDRDRYEEHIGSYVDLEHDLPGESCLEETDLVKAIETVAARGFTLTDEQQAKADEWFAHKDRNNRQRTYNFIVEKGF